MSLSSSQGTVFKIIFFAFILEYFSLPFVSPLPLPFLLHQIRFSKCNPSLGYFVFCDTSHWLFLVLAVTMSLTKQFQLSFVILKGSMMPSCCCNIFHRQPQFVQGHSFSQSLCHLNTPENLHCLSNIIDSVFALVALGFVHKSYSAVRIMTQSKWK